MCWFITFTVTPFSTIFLMLSARILSTIGMPLGISSLLFLYFHLTGSHQISQSEMRFYCVSHTEQQKNNNNWWQLKYILYFIYHKNSSNSVHSHHLKSVCRFTFLNSSQWMRAFIQKHWFLVPRVEEKEIGPFEYAEQFSEISIHTYVYLNQHQRFILPQFKQQCTFFSLDLFSFRISFEFFSLVICFLLFWMEIEQNWKW